MAYAIKKRGGLKAATHKNIKEALAAVLLTEINAKRVNINAAADIVGQD